MPVRIAPPLTRRLRVLAFSLASIAAISSSHAALIAYEPFNYTPPGADLLGQSGGGSFGFATPWIPGGFNASVNTNYDIAPGSLSSGALLTSGNRASSDFTNAIAGVTRSFATPIGTPGTTRYYSFLIRPEGNLNQGAFNGFLGLNLEAPDPAEPELFVGKPGGGAIGQIVIEDRGGTGQISSGVPAVTNQAAYLLVVKAQFTAGNDTFTLYVNPTPGAPEPASGVVKNDSNIPLVSGFTLYSTGAFSIDELRLGETFADVTPVPEPASLAMFLLPFPLLRRPRRR